jgi:hypothetical protein
MVLLAIMALLGAVLGALVKPGILAVPIGVGLAAGLRSLIGQVAPGAIDNPNAPVWSQLALQIASSPMGGYVPLLSVCGGAALISSLLCMAIDRRSPTATTFEEATRVRRPVRNGRYLRDPDMVEQRLSQRQAEARQKALLGL